MNSNLKNFDIGVVGGLGHIGLPLSLILAKIGYKVLINDINQINKQIVSKGEMPFKEDGAKELLKKFKKNYHISNSPTLLKNCKSIIVCLGTPVDKYHNPEIESFLNILRKLKKNINKKSTIIIRSSLCPGVTEDVKKIFGKNVAYCPERIVQGKSIEEISKIPQIVSGFSKKAIKDSTDIFKKTSKKTILTTVKEAEFIKLFLNSYRYIGFALTNQFYQICEENGIDYSSLRQKMISDYPRAKYIPSPGFAAGPCLYKDTLQLFSVAGQTFSLGMDSIITNENLPKFIIDMCLKKFNCRNKTLGILGMSFKRDIDDPRDSLSFKLLKYSKRKFKKTIYTDPYYKDNNSSSLKEVIDNADILIIATPHSKYDKLKFPKNKILINVWK